MTPTKLPKDIQEWADEAAVDYVNNKPVKFSTASATWRHGFKAGAQALWLKLQAEKTKSQLGTELAMAIAGVKPRESHMGYFNEVPK